MPKISSYEKTKTWQKARVLDLEVYSVTDTSQKSEVFGLTSQLRRAAISIPMNIVEGYARQTQKVFGVFLDTAYTSLVEVKYLLSLSKKLGYITPMNFTNLESLSGQAGKLLWSCAKGVKSDDSKR